VLPPPDDNAARRALRSATSLCSRAVNRVSIATIRASVTVDGDVTTVPGGETVVPGGGTTIPPGGMIMNEVIRKKYLVFSPPENKSPDDCIFEDSYFFFIYLSRLATLKI
jgi:hypothetical protein